MINTLIVSQLINNINYKHVEDKFAWLRDEEFGR